MTATEQLRKLLDERGMEHADYGGKGHEDEIGRPATWWSSEQGECAAIQRDDDLLTVKVNLTPEQAVAATLGQEDTYTREDVEGAFVSGYSLGSLPVGSDPQWDENRQTVDEHMSELGWVRKDAATPGAETCVMEYGGDVAEGTARVMDVYFCSECGSPNYNDCMPYYCIYCGKAVKR